MRGAEKLRSGLVRALAAILLLVPLPASAFVHDPELGWGSTKHIDFSLINYVLDRYHCMRSEEDFLGCVQMVNAMGSFSQPPVALLPRTPWVGARVTATRDFGSLVLATLDDPGDLPGGPARTAVLQDRRYALRQAANAAFREQRDRIKGRAEVAEIEFDSLAKELLDKRSPGISQAYAIGYAANALIEVHDPHAGFSVQTYDQSMIQDPDGAFVGIGAAVEEIPGDTRLQIYRVFDGSPAAMSGLRSLDVLLQIGNQNATGLRNNQFATLMHANEGKSIPFMVERDGAPLPDPIYVTPGKISFSNPEMRVLNDLGQKVLYVRIRTFWDDRICEKVQAALTGGFLPSTARKVGLLEEIAPDIRGVILDLRDNRGGIVEKAACVAGLFVGPRRIAVERSVLGDGKTKVHDSNKERLTRRPVAVLINDMTASAAEIVAGALQDYASIDSTLNHVFLVGTRSHGKGSVQRGSESFEFPELLRTETVARYQLPLDHPLNLVGLTPDFEVFRGLEPSAEDRSAIREADFSFVPRKAMPWSAWEPSAERAALIKTYAKDCLRGQAEAVWAQGSARAQDFQALKAQELVTCRPSI